jgi:hypothetical protein
MRDPYIGAPHPSPPEDRKIAPRFPLALIDDIPIVLVSGYSLGGQPEPAIAQIAYFAQHCSIRGKPLEPPSDPLAVYAKLMSAPQWAGDFSGWDKDRVRNQLLRLIRTVYRVAPNSEGKREFHYWQTSPTWEQIVADVEKLGIRWDRQRQCYVLKNGKTLPEEKPFDDSVHVWEPKAPDIHLRVSVHRTAPKRVDVNIHWDEPAGVTIQPARVLVFRKGEKDPLDESVLPFSTDVRHYEGSPTWATVKARVGTGSYCDSGINVNVPEGTELQVGFEVKGQSGPMQLSPVMKL